MGAKIKTSGTRREPEAGEEYKPGSLAIFEFTPEDLRANQRGYLTDTQRGWLQSTARGITGCSMASAPIALGFVLLGLTITLGLYLSNEDSRRALFSDPMNLVGLAAAGVIGVAAVGLSVFLARRQASNVVKTQLRRAQGKARLDSDYSSSSSMTTYHVHVGEHKFSFGDDMNSVFREGNHYNVYFCQSGPYQLIMSFEQIAG
jgi:hypothetical protein